MSIIGRLGCMMGRHRRSRGKARLVGEAYMSKCANCGIAMRQVTRNQWEVDTGQPYDRHSGRFIDIE